MVMRIVRRTVDFAAGVTVGAVGGAVVAYLAAPRSGDDLRKEGQALIDSAILSGERARIDREGELRDRFRAQTGNSEAFTQKADHVGLDAKNQPSSVPLPS